MLGALRAPAVVLKKNIATTAKAVRGKSRCIAVEVITNRPKIIASAHLLNKRLPLEQFTATLEELDKMSGQFPSHEVLMGTDANTKLAGHSDGFRVEYAVPHSDMSAREEERATFFVNVMAKNGLAAQNIWTSTAAPKEDMHTRKDWDKQEVMGNLTLATQVDTILTSETVKAKSCRVEENTFTSTDHKAGFQETDTSKEEKKRANKTNIKN